jgi:sigma-B regulation protein RsbU (phosphoserine phosphatase)
LPRRIAALTGLLSLALAATLPLRAQTAPLVDATTLGTSPTVYLNTWRFHLGDSPTFADPAFDDSTWPIITTDKRLAAQGYAHRFPSFCWYRATIAVPANADLSLFFAEILSTYEVFVDGQKLGQFGGLPPHEKIYETSASAYPIPTPKPPQNAAPTRILHVAIRVWAHPFESAPGIEPNASYLGLTSEIANRLNLHRSATFHDNVQFIISTAVSLVMGIVLLLVYLNQRSQREWLWLGLASVAASVSSGLFALNSFSAIPVGVARGIGIPLDTLSLAFTLQFVIVFLGIRHKLWTRSALAILIVAAPVMGIGSWTRLLSMGVTGAISAQMYAAYSVILLALLTLWWLRGNREAGILLFPMTFSLIYSVGDLLGQVAFALHLQTTNQSHNVLPAFKLPGGAFDSEFLCAMLYVLAILLILLRRSVLSTRQSERLGAEFAAARSVQQVLIPEQLPQIPGLQIESAYLPAQEVGGDFFQILPLPHGRTFIILGDVSGKGLPAAMTVSLLVGAIRTLAEYVNSPADLLAGLNRRLYGRGPGFATCLAILIHPNGEVTLANAGHLNPYVDGIEVPTHPNLPLGLDPDIRYENLRIRLEPAQQLTLITDGVLEAMNPTTKELFGFDRSREISTKPPREIAEAARTFGQNDDITVLTITPAAVPIHLFA